MFFAFQILCHEKV
uniref:Uncharacterized protein n=1 Tax=Anguilla anguilla TaxID=7936 RepID=A0A0E9RMH1_ANGAN